ncbi:MAG: alpha/beta fold hydrolase [Myxococcota bacterium]
MSLSNDLGEVKEVQLSAGTLRYRERGEGPPLLFVHGLLVNGDLWRKVVPALSKHFRCICPDLPLGAHEIPLRADADLSIPGVARLIVELVEQLELDRPTIVANDTGGAITQVVMTEHAESIGRVVLTSCDCFDNFLPPMFQPIQKLAHVPPLLTALLQPLRIPALRRLPMAFGWLAKNPIEAEIERGYAASVFSKRGVRRDVYKVLRDISSRYTMKAAGKLSSFEAPVLIAWAADDRFFPLAHGQRLANLLPNARFTSIEDSYTFVSEDQPEALVKGIAEFLSAEV